MKCTGTIFFITKSQVSIVCKVTYTNWVCTIRLYKEETRQVCMTAGGDRLDCPYDFGSPAVFMTNSKLHINSIIFDANLGS